MVVVENLSRKVSENNITYNYYYRMIKSEVTLSEYDLVQIQSYGIEIERQDEVDGRVVNIERDRVNNISPHRHKVYNLLKTMYNNTVSPMHLIDVLGEYVDNCIDDFDEVLKNIQMG